MSEQPKFDAGDVTQLLADVRSGDSDALDRVIPLIYDDLRRLARNRLRQVPRGTTLDTTGLVHEAWLRLARATNLDFKDRSHFLCACARAMRQIVISRARKRMAAKRGSGESSLTLDDHHALSERRAEDLLALDQALTQLGRHDPVLVRVVECRHFAGLSGEETAQALDLSASTVERHWVRARAWLRHALDGQSLR